MMVEKESLGYSQYGDLWNEIQRVSNKVKYTINFQYMKIRLG